MYLKKKKRTDEEKINSIISEINARQELPLLYTLWLIKKYKIPYVEKGKTLHIDKRDEQERKINYTALIMKDIFSQDVNAIYTDESRYVEFIRYAVTNGIYDIKKDSIKEAFGELWVQTKDGFKEINAKEIQQYKKVAVENFTKYLCDCLYFGRAYPEKGQLYWDSVNAIINDIETTALYDMKETSTYWSLLCGIISSYDDLDVFEDEEKVKETIEYVDRALSVRNKVSQKNTIDSYFGSEAYAVDLNNLGYSLLNLEKKKKAGILYSTYEDLIRKIYDEIRPLLHTTSNLKWKALVISNLGAIESRYGNYMLAVKYDLRAIAIKESLVNEEEERNLIVDKDLLLTTLKSHLNIVKNSIMAIFTSQMVYGIHDFDEVPKEVLGEYIALIGTHAVEAALLRVKIDKGINTEESENKFLDKQHSVNKLKNALERTKSFLNSFSRTLYNQKNIYEQKNKTEEAEFYQKYFCYVIKQRRYISGIEKQIQCLFENYDKVNTKSKTKELNITIITEDMDD